MVSETTTVFDVLALLGCAAVKVDSECIYRQVMHFWTVLNRALYALTCVTQRSGTGFVTDALKHVM